MTDTFNRGLIASAAVGSVVMALLMIGGVSQAAPLHEGINPDGTVVCDGQRVGKDPSPFIQKSMLRDCGKANGGDGGGSSN